MTKHSSSINFFGGNDNDDSDNADDNEKKDEDDGTVKVVDIEDKVGDQQKEKKIKERTEHLISDMILQLLADLGCEDIEVLSGRTIQIETLQKPSHQMLYLC